MPSPSTGSSVDFDAQPLEAAATFQHGGMFDRAGDDVARAISRGQRDAPDRHAVGLGAAAGEDDFARLGADQRRHLAAAPFRRPRGPRALPGAGWTDCPSSRVR